MGHQIFVILIALLLTHLAFGTWQVQASDPELTTDFAVPDYENATSLDGNFFFSDLLSNVRTDAPSDFANVTNANLVSDRPFAALEGLGISSALLQYPSGAVNPPHTHPRGTELLYVLEGTLDVGLIDAANNKLFTKTLEACDLFVFPKGLVHFQINNGHHTARAYASFSSSNAGLVRLPNNLFMSNIADDVLAKSFGVSASVIDELKAANVGP